MSYVRKKSQKQEKRTAKDFGGKTQIGSGCIWTMKADVRTGTGRGEGFNESDFLIENKFTDKNFYSLKRDIWEKIEREALRDNMRIPLMQIDIQDLELIVMDKNTFISHFESSGYEMQTWALSTCMLSFKLEKEYLKDFISRTDVIPLFSLSFVPKAGFRNEPNRPLQLYICLKEDFLEVVEI